MEFNSILIYLCANITAQRPITKWAQVKKRNKTHTQIKYKKQGNVYYLNNNDNNNSINKNQSYH
jgi:hypothetical protein